MKIFIIFIIFYAVKLSAEAPQWFHGKDGQMGDCETFELCFLGSGETKEAALTDARTEFSKFFETKIRSSQKYLQNYSSKGSISQSSIDEWSIKKINEESEAEVVGLAVKKIEEKNQKYYVLMGINKKDYSESLLSSIMAIDDENNRLIKMKTRFSILKVLSNLNLIEKKRIAYNLLTSKKLKLAIERMTVNNEIFKLRKLKFAVKNLGENEKVLTTGMLSEIFSPIKINFVKDNDYLYILEKEIITKELFFNVKGFKKVQVEFKLGLKDRAGKVFGKVIVSNTEIGRTIEQAIEKSIPKLKEDLITNLYLLSTEVEGVKL